MDRMFSMDDLSDGFWSPHTPPIDLHDDAAVEQTSTAAAASASGAGMNRSSSEWAFQRFLQESDDIVKIKPNPHRDNHDQPPPPPPPSIPIDPVECQALLKSRLELACAAVALTRASNGKAVQSAASATDIGSQVSNSSSITANGRESSKTQVKDLGGTVGGPPLPAISMKYVTQVRSTTSGSSGDQSDDDEAEGETEDTQNMDPTDTKRMRRMLSNRESARRSRRRKQAHLTERETQVSQLKIENSSLLKRLTDINQKYNESAVDNRVLKADVETLRAKVKMAEENVKRVTGLNSLFHAMSEIPIPTASVPTFVHNLETSAESSVPIQDDPTQHYYHSMPNNHLTNHRIQTDLVEIPRPENAQPNTTTATGGNKMGGTVPMQRVGSLEHPQKHGTSSSAARGAGKL